MEVTENTDFRWEAW